jgi:hypothetical protein
MEKIYLHQHNNKILSAMHANILFVNLKLATIQLKNGHDLSYDQYKF